MLAHLRTPSKELVVEVPGDKRSSATTSQDNSYGAVGASVATGGGGGLAGSGQGSGGGANQAVNASGASGGSALPISPATPMRRNEQSGHDA